MQFTIPQDTFFKALARVQGIVEKRNTIPILSNVLIEADNNTISLVATDLEVGMKATYPATVTKPGKITVSAKKLFEIIKELPAAEVDFKAKDNSWIEIRCGKALFNIVGLSPEEFPYFPDSEELSFLPLDGDNLKNMIDKTSFAISTDETKYNLNGIFFKYADEDETPLLRLVATDGHRLALIQEKVDRADFPQLAKGVILPRKGVLELKKLIDESDEPLNIGFLENNAVIKKDQTVVVMRLVDGEFPDYNRVIPQTRDQVAILDRDGFLHALKRMSILSSERSRGIKLTFKDGTLEISSSNPDLGEAREEMEIDYQGPEVAIGFNSRYLIDIMQAVHEEKIAITFKDNLSPSLIEIPQQDEFMAVVMPMRL
ncbi:MAG: DNA polymerase III subunit beta [Desulfuromonadales bacterium]|nr:DNA polymerase III subunit beta [Desulfuromonadales bacterium]NIR33177.1 DNA polymerase III subunit beta [Desulfuromonadales bacterium]NIS39401.1 DNA polymerase III subunit beta [Desulfuromonadales bacterium]